MCRNYFIKLIQLLMVPLILLINSCTDLTSNNTENETVGKLQIISPVSNTTIYEGQTAVAYNLAEPYSIRFIELYINGEFYRNFPPGQNNTPPKIVITLDSTFINKNINLFLIYYDNNGSSQKSNEVLSLNIQKSVSPPLTPYDLKLINFQNGSINLSWKDSSLHTDYFEVWKKTGYSGSFELLKEIPGSARNINDNNLNTLVTYYYKIRGKNQYGFSNYSVEINTDGTVMYGNLIPPSNLNAVVQGMHLVTLTWNDNSNNENYFSIERRSEFTEFEQVGVVFKDVKTFKDSANGLYAGGNFFYRIKAFSDTDSALSNTVSASTPLYNLDRPTNLTANYNSTLNVVELSWVNNDSRIKIIELERKTNNGDFILYKSLDAINDLFLDFNISRGNTYSYRVRGYDYIYYTDYSNILTININ